MAKVRNEGNRSKHLSFAAQISPRRPMEEKVLRDFNSPGQHGAAGKQVDGTATKDHRAETPPRDVAIQMAEHRGKAIHKQATKGKDKDGPSP